MKQSDKNGFLHILRIHIDIRRRDNTVEYFCDFGMWYSSVMIMFYFANTAHFINKNSTFSSLEVYK
jgi:hypothetical protein